MIRTTVLLLALIVCIATATQAQTEAPNPDPALKKLAVHVGHWTYEGENNPALGPGGKYTGEATCQMILGGFFLQCQEPDKGAESEMRLLEICGYDPVNKDFPSEFYFSDGSRVSAVLTITGSTWTFAGKLATAGKQYQFKATFVYAPDLTSATENTELSTDGKTWTPFGEEKWTKVKPAAKK